MQTSRRKTYLIAGGLALAALTLLAIILYPQVKARWIQPLGPGLGLPTLTPNTATNLQPSPTLAALSSTAAGSAALNV